MPSSGSAAAACMTASLAGASGGGPYLLWTAVFTVISVGNG
jgi:hypothetical protein